mgnify:CR=1 FL=1
MFVLFVCVYMFLLWSYVFFIQKQRFSIITYITAGVYFPLFLYLLYWSDLSDRTESFVFDYIFVTLAVLCTIYVANVYKGKNSHIRSIDGRIYVTKFGRQLYGLINCTYIVLYFLENYLGSGSFVPGLVGIDIHTYSAPIISYFTNAQYLLLAYNYYYYKSTRRKSAIAFSLVDIIIPVITRLARMSIVMAIVQIGSLILFFETDTIKKTISKFEKKKIRRIKQTIFLVAAIGFVALSTFTQYRMNLHNAEFTYGSGIAFSGPKRAEWLAPFYGYFPMSFNNLKINILRRKVTHNYIGLYSFFSLYFGLFQVDNLFGLDTTGQLKNRLITNGLATVPTAFWDYYYDFDLLLVIPIIVAMFISYKFEKKSRKESKKLTYRTLYFWYVPYWFFTSFQNTLFLAPAIVVAMLTYYIIKHSFKVDVSSEIS